MIGQYVNILEGEASASLSIFLRTKKTATRLCFLNYKYIIMKLLKTLLKFYSMTSTFFVSTLLFAIIAYNLDWMVANFLSGFFALATFVMLEEDTAYHVKYKDAVRFKRYKRDQAETLSNTHNNRNK